MHVRNLLLAPALAGALAFSCLAAARDLGRETLASNDGWAAAGSGTTGGAAAAPERVHTVRTRNELVAALAFPDATPKIVYVDGTIDGNVDDANNALSCEDYYRPDATTGTLYSLAAFLATYDPAVWGRVNPSGPLERARAASAAAQQARVRIRVPANTTIVGLGKKAKIKGAWLDIRPSTTSGNVAMNVIVRNLSFFDTFDCFPQWSPTDGATGNWNSLYDAISVRNATNVWIDHNRFEDRDTIDTSLPTYFGRLYQVHDGFVDVTNESDYVTVSWNRFYRHDKAMLIGSSDGATADRGKLRVTLHHNLFDGVGQRVPRVRFGQVHVYNNYYKADDAASYTYTWGVGVESAIVAQNNLFKGDAAIAPDFLIDRFNGTAIRAEGTYFGGTAASHAIDPVSAWNAVNDPDLGTDVGWTPVLHGTIDATRDVPSAVQNDAGPFVW